ncbi:hypothetical protein [Bacillus sp. X1(2014)]|nr:hypothetical protein [Bacillus sp. X1(2014)]
MRSSKGKTLPVIRRLLKEKRSLAVNEEGLHFPSEGKKGFSGK